MNISYTQHMDGVPSTHRHTSEHTSVAVTPKMQMMQNVYDSMTPQHSYIFSELKFCTISAEIRSLFKPPENAYILFDSILRFIHSLAFFSVSYPHLTVYIASHSMISLIHICSVFFFHSFPPDKISTFIWSSATLNSGNDKNNIIWCESIFMEVMEFTSMKTKCSIAPTTSNDFALEWAVVLINEISVLCSFLSRSLYLPLKYFEYIDLYLELYHKITFSIKFNAHFNKDIFFSLTIKRKIRLKCKLHGPLTCCFDFLLHVFVTLRQRIATFTVN